MRNESIPDEIERRLRDLSLESKFMLLGILITCIGVVLRILSIFSGNVELFVLLVGWFGFFVSFGFLKLDKAVHRLALVLVSLGLFLIMLGRFWPEVFEDVIVLIGIVIGLIIGAYVLNIYLFRKVGEQESPI